MTFVSKLVYNKLRVRKISRKKCKGKAGEKKNGDLVTHWRCGGSLEMWWVIGDVVAHWGCGGSLEMWWLIGDVVAHLRYGGSLGDVVAHWRCGGSLWRCGGSF